MKRKQQSQDLAVLLAGCCADASHGVSCLRLSQCSALAANLPLSCPHDSPRKAEQRHLQHTAQVYPGGSRSHQPRNRGAGLHQ